MTRSTGLFLQLGRGVRRPLPVLRGSPLQEPALPGPPEAEQLPLPSASGWSQSTAGGTLAAGV